MAEGNNNYTSVDGVLFNKDKTILIEYAVGKSVTSYTIPNSVTSIGGSAFYGCASLSSITIPNSVTSIVSGAFTDCTNLTNIVIPNSITNIGFMAFADCNALTDVYYTGTEEQWRAIEIEEENDSLKNATIHYNYKPAAGASTPAPTTEPVSQQTPAQTTGGNSISITLNINSATATVNGQSVALDATPYMVEINGAGYTMVPLRLISEQLGAQVDYNAATQGISIIFDDKVINLTIGQADKAAGLDVPPLENNGRTYVPLRYVSEQLGAQVDYDFQTQSITIK